jgi:hypothetical protein
MTRLDQDRFLSRWMSLTIVAVAVQIAAVTAYIPLSIIGPDPSREHLLLWVIPTWIVASTITTNLLLRHGYRRFLTDRAAENIEEHP